MRIIRLREAPLRFFLAAAPIIALLAGHAVQAQVTDDPIDLEIPQEERICNIEIAEVEERMEERIDEFPRLEQARLQQQLREAQDYCDEGNEVMAAIRLEAVIATLEVARPPAPIGEATR